MNRWLGNGSNLAWTADQFAPYHPVVYTVTAVAGAAFLVLPLLLRSKLADPPGILLHFCLGTMCFVLASPVAWEHHFDILPGVFIIAVGTVVASSSGGTRRLGAAALSIAWLMCASKLDVLANQLSDTVLNPLQATHLAGALLLLAVLSWLVFVRGRAGSHGCRGLT